MRPRIALVGSYPPPFGGVSAYMLQLFQQLKTDSFPVHVFARNRLSGKKPAHVSHYSAGSPDPSQNLFFMLRKFDPQIIHSQQAKFNWRLGLLAHTIKVPVVHHIHGERFPQQFACMSPFRQWMIRFAAKASSAIIVVSSDLFDFLLRLGVNKRRIHLVPSLLPLEEIPLAYEEREATKQIQLVTSGFYPFANPHYGFELVPPVAKHLQDHNISFVWNLVAQANDADLGRFREKLVEMGLQSSIKWVGELERPQMLGLLRDSHLYVRTKYSDSFGIVIAEAHQLGCHCLFGDRNPYFREGPRLTKYQTGDIRSLTEKLLEIVPEIPLDKPQVVQSPFATEAMANYEAIKRIYEELVSR